MHRFGELPRREHEDWDGVDTLPLCIYRRLPHLLPSLVRLQVRERRRAVEPHLRRRLEQHRVVGQRARLLEVPPPHGERERLAFGALLPLGPQHQPVRVRRVAQRRRHVEGVPGGAAKRGEPGGGCRMVQRVHALAPRLDVVCASRVEEERPPLDGEVEGGVATLLLERAEQPGLPHEAVGSHRVAHEEDLHWNGRGGGEQK
mmetsp:Transcript_36718/g.84131  ORF Transcript_36718/g.84131 Transcript_36718/m.84131 type:complete len:202 (+) Transcript_36718:474-1079(+)